MPTPTVDAKTFQTGWSGITETHIGRYLQRELNVSEQELVETLISEAEAEICLMCNRQFKYDAIQYSETFDCGQNKYVLHNFPIATLVSVAIDGVVQTLVLGTDYFVYSGYIYFVNAPVSAIDQRRSLVITYTISKFWNLDLIRLTKQMVSYMFLNSENAGLASTDRSFANLREAFDIPMYEKTLKDTIGRYRNHIL